MILAGVSLSTLFAAIVTLAIVRAQSSDYAAAIVAWLAGSMAGRGWHDLAVDGAVRRRRSAARRCSRVAPLNALRVGDLRARSVGVDVDRAQWIDPCGIVAARGEQRRARRHSSDSSD